VLDCAERGPCEQFAGELVGRRLHFVSAIWRLRRVEANQHVEVQRTTPLVLRDLDVGHAHAPVELPLADPDQAGELARDSDRGAAPELWRHRVPQRRVFVVEAFRAERLAELGIVFGVELATREPHAVPADLAMPARPATSRLAARREAPGVHEAEARRRQRQEQHRMSGDRLGNALAAAQASDNELESIAAIRLCARRAHRLATPQHFNNVSSGSGAVE